MTGFELDTSLRYSQVLLQF